jgi:hypothetical protein
MRAPARMPGHVAIETIREELRLRSPYRGIVTGRETLRLRVTIAPRRAAPVDVVIDVDDLAVEVRWAEGAFVVGAGAIDALFCVECQPRFGEFLTWFAVFARQRGKPDRLLLVTPEERVARFVERAIEDRLGLDDEPVRGEVRLAL